MPGGDCTPIFSILGGDEEMAELVEMFVDEMPARIERLESLAASANWEQLGNFAHQMKGACGSYGFDQLTPLALRLETAVRGGDSPDAARVASAELASAFRNTRCGAPC